MSALGKVRKYFPDVTKVVDSKESITVQVLKKDSMGKKKAPQACAMARACERHLGADGAIINVGFSYVIHGNKAIRYKTSEAVGREITSFDRHGEFSEGKYVLGKISPCNRLGRREPRPGLRGPHLTKAKDNNVAIHRHRTEHIRVSGNGHH